MNHDNIEEGAAKIAEWIDACAAQTNKKGLVHCTYAVAELLRGMLSDNPRYIFHDKFNKNEQLRRFNNSRDGIFIASGLYEGLDLAYDAGRWQVITQVPFPSLDDLAVAERLAQDPDWYRWQCAKSLLQACGRISRCPDDWGVTFVLDKQFDKFFKNNQDILPKWFMEAVI
jgi:Rad3-related DNA helicase